MSIQTFTINFPGQNNGVHPRFGHLSTTDALATVTSAGYLNPFMQSQGFSILASDIIFVFALDGTQIYKPVIGASGIVTLTVLP
jgi:hypothetical protein